jgi:HrpA-like RNA helicase
LLEGKGSRVSILCTQPRRVAAMSVAERVSDEMCEESIGKLVGYQIRLEARRSSATKLLFCTTGVILRRLVEDPSLSGISHVMVDEVHERQWQIDVLLVALRGLVNGARPDLKVILVRQPRKQRCSSTRICCTLTLFSHLSLSLSTDVRNAGCRAL